MNSSKKFTGRVMIFNLVMTYAILAFAPVTSAQDRKWINTSGGKFNEGGNWDSGVPTASENAIFGLNGTFTVDLTADATIFSLQQHAGDITFSGGNTLTSNDLSHLNHGTMTLSGTTLTNLQSVGRDGGTGATGNAFLNVLSGGNLIGGAQTLMGVDSGTSGTATISGAGSQLNSSGSLTVGHAGTGTLNVLDGGFVSVSGASYIGRENGAMGTAIVSGAGSQLDLNAVRVGLFGTGILRVEAGGNLTTSSTFADGGSGASSSIVVRDPGSIWNNSGSNTQIRNNGSLLIENGGTANIGSLLIEGVASASTSLRVTGNSTLNATSQILVRSNGTGTISVDNGGSFTSGATYITADVATASIIATVTDTGSRWNSDGVIVRGSLGGSAILNIQDGGQFNTTTATIGTLPGRGTVNVSGANSALTGTSTWLVGDRGIGHLNISDSGRATTTGAVTIAAFSDVTISDGHFQTGTLTNNGNINATAGNVVIEGMSNNEATGVVASTGNANTKFQNRFVNGGEVFTDAGSTVTFSDRFSGAGSFTGTGDVLFNDEIHLGESPSSVGFEGDVFLGANSKTFVEIAGTGLGDFDQFDVAGDLSLDGTLSVSLIDGFSLGTGQEFLIADVDGLVNGQFDFFGEGDLVGNFGGRDLFISYSRGSGNDIGLFTTSVPEPGTAGVLGIALIGLLIRRKRQKTTIKGAKIQSGLLAMLVIATVSSSAATASADVVVTNRHSLGAFDVVAVFPGEFERRNVSDESTSLTGMFTMSESFDAVVTNGVATGTFDHTENVVSNSNQLSITSTSSMQGSATQTGNAVAGSSIAEFLLVRFTVSETANFRMTGDFDPADAFGDQVFLTETLGGLDFFRFSTEQSFDVAGTLAAGDYTFRVDNGSATNENTGFAFSGGHNFTLNVTGIPEPGSLSILGLLGTFMVFKRRRRQCN